MASDESALIGHPLSASERRDWRLIALAIGALLILLAYPLPMFTQRITYARTRFSGGTVVTSFFPFLVNGQYFTQMDTPTQEELQDVEIRVSEISGHGGSALSWLLTISRNGSRLWRFLSLFICLLMPAVSAATALVLSGRSWTSREGLAEAWIPISIVVSLLGVLTLFLVWCHQFDFSTRLLAMAREALAPRPGFWVMGVGLMICLVAGLALRRETRRDVVTWWALVFIVAFSIWLLTRVKPYPFMEIWRFISDGILVTLRIVTTSFGFILIVSLLGGLGRISRSKIIYGISSLYVEIIRGIPLLVQLLFIWFALPQVFDGLGNILMHLSSGLEGWGQRLIDLRMSPFVAAVVGLTTCYGAYGSEIFRAGISSIHQGQMEAARSLGMNYFQAMRHVILPQAVRVILPPIGNEFVALLKDSSLVSVLAVSDLTRRGREYMARTFLSFDTWIMVALCYLVLTLFSSRVVEFIEAKSRFDA